MSKEYWCFENEAGGTAFLAGVVDVISDDLSLMIDFPDTIDADIFPAENNDLSLLNETVRKRLHYYNDTEGHGVPKENIDRLDIQLEEVTKDVEGYFLQFMHKNSSDPKAKEEVRDFLRTLEWHLGRPQCIYSPKNLHDNIQTFGRIYLYMAWEYFFIAYRDHLVLIVLGTVE